MLRNQSELLKIQEDAEMADGSGCVRSFIRSLINEWYVSCLRDRGFAQLSYEKRREISFFNQAIPVPNNPPTVSKITSVTMPEREGINVWRYSSSAA